MSYSRAKAAAYTTNLSMSVIGNLSPLLFTTFHDLYQISYGLLGLLVLINFCTQLIVDLVFSFYSHKFHIARTLRVMPYLTIAGLFVFALVPVFAPSVAYVGIVIGTILFASSSGLSEVLISPMIAAIYPENSEREMSKLHSVYAWGVVGMVIVSTVVLYFAGTTNWYWLVLGWTIIPIVGAILFSTCKIPPMPTPQRASGTLQLFRNRTLILCILCIFFGGASECTMAQWGSGYIEQALQFPKLWGDVFGVAMFAAMLGLGRTLYGIFGKHLYAILIGGSAGAAICYLTAALSNIPILGLIACAMTGLCTSMLWPGSLVAVSERYPDANVAVFALMAAGGDLGGSIGPQLTGIITDAVMANPNAEAFAARFHLTAEQLGMKAGLLFCVIFPILATICFALVWRDSKRNPARMLSDMHQ